tara:strand:+ start:210 stop:362 length:153 start_codon:yes stop_codon:yes gene_type:complete
VVDTVVLVIVVVVLVALVVVILVTLQMVIHSQEILQIVSQEMVGDILVVL